LYTLRSTNVERVVHRDVGLKCLFRYQNADFLLLLVVPTFIFYKVV